MCPVYLVALASPSHSLKPLGTTEGSACEVKHLIVGIQKIDKYGFDLSQKPLKIHDA